jgi:hypothetical protein
MTTKLEKLSVVARHPFPEALERVGQFRRRRLAPRGGRGGGGKKS